MGILNKIGDMLFGPSEYEEGEVEEVGITENRYEARREEKRDLVSFKDDSREYQRSTPKKGKVVNITSTTQFEVVVLQPENFEEAREIAENLKSNKPVIVNLEKIEKEQARRMVDFVSGAAFALGGEIQKISNMIFLVTPYNVGIMGDFKDELKNKGIFPWSY